MNERILELRDKCIVQEQKGTSAFDSYVVDRFDTEKFAELIVRECAEVATMNGHQWQPVGTYVLKHFGVGV